MSFLPLSINSYNDHMKTKELLFVLFGFYINMVTSDVRYFTQKMGVKSFARNHKERGQGRNEESQKNGQKKQVRIK